MTDPTSGPRFLTIADVAAELATSEAQIYAILRSGELRAIQIGGRRIWRIERSMLEAYIDDAYRKAAENIDELPSDPKN